MKFILAGDYVVCMLMVLLFFLLLFMYIWLVGFIMALTLIHVSGFGPRVFCYDF